MQAITFVQSMSKGHCPATGADLSNSSYCIFSASLSAPIVQENITGDDTHLELCLRYHTESGQIGMLRLRQMQTNVIVEESAHGHFFTYLQQKEVKYLGQLILYALQFKIENLLEVLGGCAHDMSVLENQLDKCIDNSGTYQILDFRRKYTDFGTMVISVKEILTRIDKGYYPMQMQSSYVLQGQVALQFQFLEERYDLIKSTLIKDLDTYTSIINNNINRNTRLLSIISLVGVVLNFVFGSLISVNPVLGIAGGLAIAGLSAVAVFRYHAGSRQDRQKSSF